MKKNNLNWSKVIGYVIIYFMLLFGGFSLGMIYQQMIFIASLVKVAEGLEGTTFNVEVDINETLMTDRITENMKPILWEIRMQNCTKTEKGYCAIECYENGDLMPCENFTNDEHFCDNGKCEVAGICPTYYEKLRGKKTLDCMNEIIERQENEDE